MSINTFVIGAPIAHSRSPLIHNHWINQHKLDGHYQAVEVLPENLKQFVARIRAGEFAGGNVTIPHKEGVFPLCDEIEFAAKIIGAVNTLSMCDGKLFGANTDLPGFLGNLDQELSGWDQINDEAIVLGAGGAARAVLVGLANRGFKKIIILNRTVEKAQKLAQELPGPFIGGALTDFANYAPRANLLVNTTAIGMHGSRFDELSIETLQNTAIVTDIVYTPIMTPLLADAQKLGLKTVDGLGMLLHQAVPGFEAWYGIKPEVTDSLRALIVKDMERH